jgi:hypothetical protein
MAECIVRIGKVGRDDPDSEVHVVRKIEGTEDDWERVVRVFVNGSKKLKIELDPGEYHVAVIGDKIAGVATTAGQDVGFPFNVHLDPPEDHSKDYVRRSVPAIPGESLKTAIKKTLH